MESFAISVACVYEPTRLTYLFRVGVERHPYQTTKPQVVTNYLTHTVHPDNPGMTLSANPVVVE
jgi:hypothetical protein